MQRFLAALLILAGLGGIGYGVATATVLRESDTVVATATPSGDGTMVVTDPGVLGLVDDQVTVKATVPEGQKVTLALGSDVDVLGWVGDDPYDAVTGMSTWEKMRVSAGPGPETDDADDAEAGDEPAEKPGSGPDPAGSDMWLSEVTGETTVSMRWTEEPGRIVLLAAGVGKGAEAPTLELTWPRPVTTPYLWPGVLGGGFALIIGVFLALGARRSKGGAAKERTTSTVRSRRPASDLPRRDAVFGVDGAGTGQDTAQDTGQQDTGQDDERSAAGFPPVRETPSDGGTAMFPPAVPGRAGQSGPPVRDAAAGAEPEQDSTRSWNAPAPFGGAAPITPPPAEPAATPQQAPVARQTGTPGSIRGLRRNRRGADAGSPQGQRPGPQQPDQQRPDQQRPDQGAPFGGAAPGRTPGQTAPAQGAQAGAGQAGSGQAAPAQGAPAAQGAPTQGKPMTRREMRMRDQAQRRAATGTMPTVPAAEPATDPEPETPQEQTPSSRAAAWRQTWGVTGNDGDK